METNLQGKEKIEQVSWKDIKKNVKDGETLHIQDFAMFVDGSTLPHTLKEIVKKDIKLQMLSPEDQWMTKDVILEMTKLYQRIANVKVQAGMKNSTRALGRPAQQQKAIDKAIEMWLQGEYTGQQVADACGISRSTLYRNLRKRGLMG